MMMLMGYRTLIAIFFIPIYFLFSVEVLFCSYKFVSFGKKYRGKFPKGESKSIKDCQNQGKTKTD